MAKAQDKKKEQRWRRLLRERRSSGKSVVKFCGERRISVHQFYWWQRQLRSRDGAGFSSESSAGCGFVPVRISLSSPAIEVVHPGGCLIRVAAGVDAKLLRCVLDALPPAEA